MVSDFLVPSRDVTDKKNSPWLGIISVRESLVSDLPAGDGKIGTLFYSVLLPIGLAHFY